MTSTPPRLLALTLALIIGCTAGAVATQLVVPPVRAGAPGNLPRWEYNCGASATFAQLNEAGAAGWELVTTHVVHDVNALQNGEVVYCFKRPVG